MNQEISKKVVSLFFSKTKKELRKELKLSEKELQKYIDLNGLKKIFFISEEEKEKAKELALEGKTLDFIGKELGYSIVTIWSVLRDQGISIRKIKEESKQKRDIEIMKRSDLTETQKAKILNISYQNLYAKKKD